LEGRQQTVRPFVSSGLGNWRMVVQQQPNGGWFKFVCGKGKFKFAPSTVPAPTDGWTQLLYDVQHDHFDMNNVYDQHPEVVTRMRALLPPSFGCPASRTLNATKIVV